MENVELGKNDTYKQELTIVVPSPIMTSSVAQLIHSHLGW